jgi:hypothetical protein
VYYNATNAIATVSIAVTRGSTSYGTESGVEEKSDMLAGEKSIQATASKLLPGACGFIVNANAQGEVWNKYVVIGTTDVFVWGRKRSSDTKGAAAPSCQPPKSRVLVTYRGSSAADLNITIPQGSVASVTLDGTGSGPGESDGPALTQYNWQVNGTNWDNAATSSIGNVQASKQLALTVTDELGASTTANGSINVTWMDLCDDPVTHDVETCDGSSQGETASVGDGYYDPIEFHTEGGGNTGWSKYVCYYTDWFQWNGSFWVYLDSHLDDCWFE